jgi:hypothetical protein
MISFVKKAILLPYVIIALFLPVLEDANMLPHCEDRSVSVLSIAIAS